MKSKPAACEGTDECCLCVHRLIQLLRKLAVVLGRSLFIPVGAKVFFGRNFFELNYNKHFQLPVGMLPRALARLHSFLWVVVPRRRIQTALILPPWQRICDPLGLRGGHWGGACSLSISDRVSIECRCMPLKKKVPGVIKDAICLLRDGAIVNAWRLSPLISDILNPDTFAVHKMSDCGRIFYWVFSPHAYVWSEWCVRYNNLVCTIKSTQLSLHRVY